MTETQIQQTLATVLIDRGHSLVVPNTYLWSRSWESDLISVTSSGYVVEFEIKRSVSDFRRDREKYRHGQLQSHFDGGRMRTHRGHGPSRFMYVLDTGLDTSKITAPDYAGVLAPDGLVRDAIGDLRLSDAPRLHSNEVSSEAEDYLSRALMYRYWNP